MTLRLVNSARDVLIRKGTRERKRKRNHHHHHHQEVSQPLSFIFVSNRNLPTSELPLPRSTASPLSSAIRVLSIFVVNCASS